MLTSPTTATILSTSTDVSAALAGGAADTSTAREATADAARALRSMRPSIVLFYMRKERQIALIERLLAVMGKGPEDTCREGSIDVERYISPTRLEAEKRALFRNRPIIVGRASELPGGGSFFTHDSAGVPMLIT